ncbi:MAG TPA: type II toxin-antitoxin system PemK/MazF family toxin [Acidimicrobiales bacterium]|nr:type II toxin-antitoxin system PemK/MazF family toxin [Acidimicrobiales bacterium]
MRPRRGELWLVDFGEPVGREQAGRRPALVVSADALNEGPAGVVVVVPLTTARRGLPSHIEIEPRDSGLSEVSYAKCEDVKSISDRRLVARLGSTDPGVMFSVGRTLTYLLDL